MRYRKPESSRLRVFSVSESILWDALVFWDQHEFIHLPRIADVPEDAKVIGVHHDSLAKSFCFLIEHPSFDEVAPGDIVPRFLAYVEAITFRCVRGPEPIFIEQSSPGRGLPEEPQPQPDAIVRPKVEREASWFRIARRLVWCRYDEIADEIEALGKAGFVIERIYHHPLTLRQGLMLVAEKIEERGNS